LLTAACATPPQTAALRSSTMPYRPVELKAVPFFAQEDYQCGPAALATVLVWSGVNITPAELTPQVYVPSRKGSLQIELLGATRRQGRIPYVLQPRLAALLTELSSGHPTLVLLNLGLSWYPVWHYAVVIGYDIEHNQIIMRSGRLPRDVVRMEVFERIWARSGYWALLVLPPDALPATAEESPYLQAVTELERLQQWRPAASAYETALKQWPDSLVAALGLGNARYALSDLAGAEQAFREAVDHHPEAAPAYNNLAQVLADEGRYREAELMVRQALKLGGPLRDTYKQTLQEIQDRATAARHRDTGTSSGRPNSNNVDRIENR
jgi:hypothetical protein